MFKYEGCSEIETDQMIHFWDVIMCVSKDVECVCVYACMSVCACMSLCECACVHVCVSSSQHEVINLVHSKVGHLNYCIFVI